MVGGGATSEGLRLGLGLLGGHPEVAVRDEEPRGDTLLLEGGAELEHTSHDPADRAIRGDELQLPEHLFPVGDLVAPVQQGEGAGRELNFCTLLASSDEGDTSRVDDLSHVVHEVDRGDLAAPVDDEDMQGVLLGYAAGLLPRPKRIAKKQVLVKFLIQNKNPAVEGGVFVYLTRLRQPALQDPSWR